MTKTEQKEDKKKETQTRSGCFCPPSFCKPALRDARRSVLVRCWKARRTDGPSPDARKEVS